MNKKELIGYVAEKADLSKKDAAAAIDAFMEGVGSVIEKGGKISLIGFGTFGVKQRAARDGVNPATKKKVRYAAKKVPFFRAGKALKSKAL
ncbi:MAG: HU family DNA-binding protein [Candidatus Sabulitectum sp.]|nr:HU family DNA-binding protein [Candidatus Sabulitectum sp.]